MVCKQDVCRNQTQCTLQLIDENICSVCVCVCEFKHDPRQERLTRVTRWESNSQGYIIQPVSSAKVYSRNVVIRVQSLILILRPGLETKNIPKKFAEPKLQLRYGTPS